MASSSRPVSSRTKAPRPPRTPDSADIPVVGGREPCPCGSGRRYKACHGRREKQAAVFVARPFEGLAAESDWVALREFVPAATARLTFAGEWAGRSATLATLLPLAWPGLVREDGEPMLALQVQGGSSDPSRDYAGVLDRLMSMEPGASVETLDAPTPGRRLQDVLDPQAQLDVTVHDSFSFWEGTVPDTTGLIAASRERADSAVTPTARLEAVSGAYWCRAGDRDYLRWVRPEPEDALVDALARLHVTGSDVLVPGSRQVGAFRAHGLLVFVWDLPAETAPASLEEPTGQFESRLAEALAVTDPLTTAERAARAGLVNRQRTLR